MVQISLFDSKRESILCVVGPRRFCRLTLHLDNLVCGFTLFINLFAKFNVTVYPDIRMRGGRSPEMPHLSHNRSNEINPLLADKIGTMRHFCHNRTAERTTSLRSCKLHYDRSFGVSRKPGLLAT